MYIPASICVLCISLFTASASAQAVWFVDDSRDLSADAVTLAPQGVKNGAPGDGDECEDCLPIEPYVAVNGTTADNTGSTGDDTSCTFYDEIDEWYCYTATCDGLATASLCGSDYDTALAVFDACGGNELGCNDDSCGLQSQVSWPVSTCETYYIRVSGFNNSTGDYTLLLSDPCEGGCEPGCEPSGAENDCCADAIGINCGDTDFDTTGANTDGPAHPDDCMFDGQTYHDIWFYHVAQGTGDLTVSTCDQADYDTDLVVYDGCNCGNLNLLGCSDDTGGCLGFTSETTVPVAAGNCYLVRVGGWMDGDMGTGTLTLSGIDTCLSVEPCGADGICSPESGENTCNCPEDCPGECACTVFTNKADFESFNEEDGKILKGVEDFEEGVLPGDAVDGFDDPLCEGIPNLPDGFPYPNGLDLLNLCVQSNILGGAATDPSPAGVNGLAAASAGFLGAVSDIVLANTFVNSLDVMFGDPVPPDQQDNHTGVGLDTLAFLGGSTVNIQVYDKNDELLLTDVSPADPAGSSFWGVWCSSTIGRINIFDPGNGAEGADNIQMWVGEPLCVGDDECDDGDACTDDICNPANPNADENGCTYSAVDCSDGNACTDEDCDSDSGCTQSPTDCDDGNACTDDGCDPGYDGCTHSPTNCDDDDACTNDFCDPDFGCWYEVTDCDDGDFCTDDGCDHDGTGKCTHTPTDICDDGNACTEDGCESDTGCTHDDIDCSDGDACTDDLCDPDTGCTHEDIECSEGQVCEPATGECVVDQDPCECVNGRVTLCHIPPGNLGNARTITVGCAARDKHLAHGDVCGPCEDGDG